MPMDAYYTPDQRRQLQQMQRRRQLGMQLMGNMAQQGGQAGPAGFAANLLAALLMRKKLGGMDKKAAAFDEAAGEARRADMELISGAVQGGDQKELARLLMGSPNPDYQNAGLGIAGQAMAPKDGWEVIQGPRGTLLQRNTLTGETTQVVGQEPKGTTVNVGANAENEFAKARAKLQAQEYQAMQQDAAGADRIVDNLTAVEHAMTNVETGALTPAKAALSKLSLSLGIKPESIGLPDAASAEQLEAAANRLTMESMKHLKGAMSDRELNFLQNAVVSLGNTPEGNRKIMQFMRDAAKRAKEKAKLADSYIEKSGDLTGFQAEWEQYMADNPLDMGMSDSESAGSAPKASNAIGMPGPRPRATNPQTGEVIEWNGKDWVPVK